MKRVIKIACACFAVVAFALVINAALNNGFDTLSFKPQTDFLFKYGAKLGTVLRKWNGEKMN